MNNINAILDDIVNHGWEKDVTWQLKAGQRCWIPNILHLYTYIYIIHTLKEKRKGEITCVELTNKINCLCPFFVFVFVKNIKIIKTITNTFILIQRIQSYPKASQVLSINIQLFSVYTITNLIFSMFANGLFKVYVFFHVKIEIDKYTLN